MSKVKLIESGGKYVGTKMKDVLKKIRHRQSAAKSKKNIEKIGLGTKSVKRYQNVASSGSGDKSAIVPVKAQTKKGSSRFVKKSCAPHAEVLGETRLWSVVCATARDMLSTLNEWAGWL